MNRIITVALTVLMTAFAPVMSASAAEADAYSSLNDRKPSKKKKAEIRDVVFSVHLHCESCVKKVQENIAFERGVKDLHVCLEDQTVAIKYDAAKTSEAVLKAAIEKLGYPVNGTIVQGEEHKHEHPHSHEH